MKREVLGVKIDDVSLEEAVDFIVKNKPHLVFTTGPEFLVTARKNLEFKKILNSADLNIPDGIGLKLFCGFKNSFAGVDLMLELCRVAAEKKLIVGLFGGQEGIAKKTKAVLAQKYPGIKIEFAIDGELKEPIKPVDFLFVALGHPKQEKFLYTTHGFRVGMGVGGSFDFISGNLPRPPVIIRKLALGWLYRGFTKPGHWKRIFNAVIFFPWLVFKKSLNDEKN
ncbi:MAG: WecB/TagA/CpsF family glycosyltransferase [bacterium]|nr:WecB/TagA/CpsF family glycosyltransferase [bacterium]